MSDLQPPHVTRRRFIQGVGAATMLPAATGTGVAEAAKSESTTSNAGSCNQGGGFAFSISSINQAAISIPDSDEPLARLGAERLADYIARVTGANPQIVSGLSPGPARGKPAIILKVKEIPYIRPNGYRIETSADTKTVCVTAVAGAGLKYGCYRLIREFRQRGHQVSVPNMMIEASPFLKNRELMLAEIQWNPTPGEQKILPELQRQFDFINWDSPTLDAYVDLIDCFGYDSVQLDSPGGLAKYAGGMVTKAEAESKAEQILRRARQNGMGTSFFVWGQEGVKDAMQNRNCPRDPEQLADIHAMYLNIIQRFGAFIDRWVMHWADPGGCLKNGCTIDTPQVVTNDFAEILLQRGLPATVSLSLWGLRWRCWEWHWESAQSATSWPGYESWRSVVESGVLAPTIAINLMRHYKYEVAQAIKGQNRKAGVWGWYLNDQEINPGMHIHTQILDSEFHRMDATAGKLLDWFSLEDNNHILNAPMLYVGAQMLWDHKTSASDALFDFCDAMWGPEAAPPIHQAMLALESARCGPGEYVVNLDLWPNDYSCNQGRGSQSPEQDLARCQDALKALDSVKADPGYVAKFRLPIGADRWLGHLRAHLEYVRDYARIRVAYREALKPALERGSFEETQRLMATLPDLPDVIPGSFGAGSMSVHYTLLRRFSATWKGRTFSDNLALKKRVTASSWFNQDPRFAPQNAVNGILCELQEEGWAADEPGPAWLKIDLGSVQTVHNVRLFNRGYRREYWDNNLRATPAKADVFYALHDPDPSSGTADDSEQAYQSLGGFAAWEPTDDPAAFQEITSRDGVQARWVKVVIYSAAGDNRVGCGEVEVR
jgi:hypothetical protein